MINIIIGLLIGFMLSYSLIVLRNLLRQKKGIKYDEYKNLPLLIRINDTLRHIIYEYGIKKENHDFLLNLFYKKNVIMQVMHRAHFPYLSKVSEEIIFGLALYIPISKLTIEQKQTLEQILEMEPSTNIHEVEPFDYHVIDLGKGIKQGGYLITRILKEVFLYDPESNDFDLKLFSEGELPYFGKKHGFTLPTN